MNQCVCLLIVICLSTFSYAQQVNFDWAISFGAGNFIDAGESIAVDGSGDVYTIGAFRGTIDFDPGPGSNNLTSQGGYDVFIQKLDPSGNFLWAKSFGGTYNDYGQSITVDASGNVYTTGYFRGTVDFDPGAGTNNLTSQGGTDVFIQKLDPSGNFLWAKSFGGTSSDYGNSITLDASGNVYTIGAFQGMADFDPGAGTNNLTAQGSYDVFIQKLDPSGNFLWAKSFGGSDGDRGLSIAVDTAGNVYTTGYFRAFVDFDPGVGTTFLSSVGRTDVFIQKLDTNGDFLWAQTFGDIQNDQANSIAVDVFGNIYTTGYFIGPADFDPGIDTFYLTASMNSEDGFVQKLNQCAANTGTDVITACDSYTWIDGQTYTASNDTATFTLMNAAGCDSVVTLDLTINNSTTGTDVITACDSYTWIDGTTYTSSNNTAMFTLTNAAGCDSVVTLDLTINSVSDITTSLIGVTITATNSTATYQWLDCDNGFAPISGETNQAFMATANGNYAVELTENGCIDTSACVSITTVGFTENSFGDAFAVYPNPTAGNFSINLGAFYDHAEVRITDVSGSVIQTKSILQTQQIDLSITSPPGLYIVTVDAGEKRAIIRVVKE
ncbi:MAG: SBBP repeat-containing protein [Chitinophagales bacterium]